MELKLFHKKELLILISLSLLLILLIYLPHGGRRPSGVKAVVSYKGEIIAELPLNEDNDYTIKGDLTATLEVRNGRIRFVNSLCPDKICEAFGWIGEPGESAICAPAKLAVQIV
ncbi:MAG: NusG domain II-containing protein [Oscillospiraceae bacterium]|nr:NusG domain II-containing protein [Oscillospiraceae bacterium]